MSLTLDESLALQKQFANHVRQPDVMVKPEGITDERMQVYRRLFFSNVQSFLDGTYPHLKTQLQDQWPILQRQFYASYEAKSPYFHRISNEFYQWLSKDEILQSPLLELAFYEQSLFDAEVFIAEFQEESIAVSTDMYSMDQVFKLKSGVELAHFEWDILQFLNVGLCNIDEVSKLPVPLFMAFYKNKKGHGESLRLAPLTMALLEQFQEPQSLLSVLKNLSELANMSVDQLQPFAHEFVQQYTSILLGIVPDS